MKVLVQWALSNPQSWEEIDSKLWTSIPQGPVPDDLNPDHIVTLQKRWIHAIKIEHIIFMGYDHYAIEEIPEGLLVTCWNDDTGDWVGDRHAEEWLFSNAPITFELFAENKDRIAKYKSIGSCLNIFPWRSFEPPNNECTRHGIWVSNELHKELIKKQ